MHFLSSKQPGNLSLKSSVHIYIVVTYFDIGHNYKTTTRKNSLNVQRIHTYTVVKFYQFCEKSVWWPLFTMGASYLLNSLCAESRDSTMKQTSTAMVMSTEALASLQNFPYDTQTLLHETCSLPWYAKSIISTPQTPAVRIKYVNA